MPTIYRGIVDPETLNRRIKDRVKDFILNVSRDENANLPSSFYCAIQGGDKLISVHPGSTWSISDDIIYLGHMKGYSIPIEVPSILSAIAQFLGIGSDPEINEAIINILIGIMSGGFNSIRRNLAQTLRGTPLTHLSVNFENGLIAALYPPDPLEPDGLPTWRLPFTAEPIDVEKEGWTPISLQV
jgi:hypothetical protein